MKSVREEVPLGYEAQADFCQYKMVDMYGNGIRVYFFTLVLSYSRMKFCYFARVPFTTESAIKAHEYAFRFFSGRPQTILYDKDRVSSKRENAKNLNYIVYKYLKI